MAEGFLIAPRDWKRLQRVVHDFESGSRTYPRFRRRQPVFQPGAGAKVYQCVYGTRLRRAETTEPPILAYHEPVCIGVQLGTVDNTDLGNLTHQDVDEIYNLIDSMGIVQADGMVHTETFDENRLDARITDIVEERLGSKTGLTLLRTRYCDGYIATGQPVVGNDSEAWFGGRGNVWEVELREKWTDGEAFYLAELHANLGAIALGTTHVGYEIFDRIILRDPQQRACIYIPAATIVLAEFDQQVWFNDDDANDSELDTPRHWYDHATHGILPVFNLIWHQPTLTGKTNASHAKNASGAVSVWTGTVATEFTLSDTGDDVTAFNRYADLDSGKWVDLVPKPHGWEFGAGECT